MMVRRWAPTVVFVAVLSGALATTGLGSGAQAEKKGALRAVSLHCFADGQVLAAAATGKYGLLFHSGDRGLTWHVQYSHGVLQGDIPEIWLDPRSSDAGNDVIYVRKLGDTDLNFSAAGRSLLPGLVSPEKDPWLVSADHGLTWAETEPRMPYVRDHRYPRSPHVVKRLDEGDDIGFLAADSPNLGKVITFQKLSLVHLVVSKDGGAHWSRVEVPGYMWPYDWLTDGHGRVVVFGKPSTNTTDGLAISVSTDGGATWATRFSDENFSAESRFFAGGHADGQMIVAGAGGKHPGRQFEMISSLDGGTTWSAVHRVTAALVDVAEIGNGRWGLFTYKDQHPTVQVSSDGGQNWRTTLVADVPGKGPRGGWILPLHDGLVIAYLGRAVTRSTDGGETWKEVDLGLSAGEAPLDASCTDGHGTLVLTGADGTVARSVDYGLTWALGAITE